MPHRSRVRLTGPLSSCAQGFAEELSRQGYKPKPVVDQVSLLAHLSRWLCRRGLEVADLEISVLNEFLGDRRSQDYAMWLSPKALAPLLGYLGEHDLLRVRTDAEKFLLLAALNLVECIAYVGAQLQPR